MVRIRLSRVGAKGRPFFRIVVTPSERARGARYVDMIGTYDPLKNPAEVKLDKERASHWLEVGASASETVERLLKNAGVAFPEPKARTRRKPVKPRLKTPKPIKPKRVKAAAPAVDESTPEPVTAEAPTSTEAAETAEVTEE